MSKQTIGRFDRADLPELGLEMLKVKIDSGAYSCSLFATAIQVRSYKGEPHLYFKTLSPKHPDYTGKYHRFKEFTRKKVKSSNGKTQYRYFIETALILFGKRHTVAFSLSDRRSMRFPVLLGRKLLREGFVIDVTRSNLSLKHHNKAKELLTSKASISK